MARYENDPYYRASADAPGNPWFVTTLWYAQHLVATARTVADLIPVLKILEWTEAHALPSGVLAEQPTENRFRFLNEIVRTILTVWPSSRVGVHLSPNGNFNDMGSPDFRETFLYAARQFVHYKLAYLHILDGLAFGFQCLFYQEKTPSPSI